MVLVYFLGGCTYAEISALRFLSQKEDCKLTSSVCQCINLSIVANTDYVIATTNIFTGQSMIQSLINDTHEYQPCGPLFDQLSVSSFQKFFKPPESQLNIQPKAY